MRDAAPPLDRLHSRQPVILRREDWRAGHQRRRHAALDNGDRFEIEQVSGQVPLPAG